MTRFDWQMLALILGGLALAAALFGLGRFLDTI